MPEECPTCGKEYGSESWLQRHHKEEHGEYIPNCTCEMCGVEFYSKGVKLKTCENCNPNAGENNPNYTGATEEGECVVCGATFEYYPSEKYGKYCADHNSSDHYNPDARHPILRVNTNGHEMFFDSYRGEQTVLLHHRLLAVAYHGFDALTDNVVHHRNGLPWDNRIENLDLMTRADHTRLHWDQGDIQGRPTKS